MYEVERLQRIRQQSLHLYGRFSLSFSSFTFLLKRSQSQSKALLYEKDAFLCALGGHDRLRVALSGHPRQPALCSIGTRNILEAMKKYGVSRLICLSAWGIGDSKGRVPVIFRNVIFPLLMKEEYEDKEAQEQLIEQSPLDWTIVRPARLTNGSRTGSYRMQSSLEFSWQSSISRADVADCMLKQLTDQTFRHKCLELSY